MKRSFKQLKMANLWTFDWEEIIDQTVPENAEDDWPIQDSAENVDITDPRVIAHVKENWQWTEKKLYSWEKLKRGDLVCFGAQGYRNEGLFVWDGDKIVNLDQETISDQGSIPREFAVTETEFYPGYWKDVIEQGGGIFWISKELWDTIGFTKVKNRWIGDCKGFVCIYEGETLPSFEKATFYLDDSDHVIVE